MSKGIMPLWADTFLAGADLTGKEGYAVKLSGDNTVVLCGAGEASIGILQTGEATGRVVRVMELGNSFGILGGNVAAGAKLAANASGALVTAAATNHVVGQAIAAGNSGETITVVVKPQLVPLA